MDDKLVFSENGHFRIMQIADAQEICMTNPDTVNLIDRALEYAQPDLVVFTGDQVKGYGVSMISGDVRAKTKMTIENVLEPLIKRNINFLFTFGNHDISKKSPADFQFRTYKDTGLCLNSTNSSGGYSPFSYKTVYSHDGNTPLFNVYMFDTGKYDGVSAEQQDEYRKIRDLYKNTLPALAFCHIPPIEIYKTAVISDMRDKRAFKGAGEFNKNYYRLGDSLYEKGMFMGENFASIKYDDGFLSVLMENGDVLGLYFGHDHNNSFVVKHDGIDLGYTQGCGFNTYGPGMKRGVRIFDIEENNPFSYSTYTLTAEELLYSKLKRPVTEYVYTHSPSSVSTAVPFVLKRTAVCAAAAVIAGGIYKMKKK